MIEYKKLTNQTITTVEKMASDLKAVPGERGYNTRINRIHSMLHISVNTVDAIIRKNIGEKWKPIPGYENYKVSNYGRILGVNGTTLISTYVSKAGVELFDPYMPNHERRRHLAIKSAITRAFLHPKNNQRVVYSGSDRINTIHHLVIAK